MTVRGRSCFTASRIAQLRAWREWSEPSTPTMIPGISAPQKLHPASIPPITAWVAGRARGRAEGPGRGAAFSGAGDGPGRRRRGAGPGADEVPDLARTRCRTWRGPSPVCDALAVRSTLFEFAGGEPAFLALAAAHHERCLR